MSWKNKACSKSREQIHLGRVDKWNKMYSFEVLIGLLPLFLIVMKKQGLFWKFVAYSFRQSWEMEQNV